MQGDRVSTVPNPSGSWIRWSPVVSSAFGLTGPYGPGMGTAPARRPTSEPHGQTVLRSAATRIARGGLEVTTLVVRMLAAYPPGELKAPVADLVGGGAAAQALQPLGGGVVFPAATTPQQLSEMLGRLADTAP